MVGPPHRSKIFAIDGRQTADREKANWLEAGSFFSWRQPGLARRFLRCRLIGSTKYWIGRPYSLANSRNSTTSTRRSPDSHFETKDRRFPSSAAAWTWVSPASSLAARSRLFRLSKRSSKTLGAGTDIDLVHDLVHIADVKTVNVHEAKTHLSRLLRQVLRGEEIVIAKGGKPVARLVPITEGRTRSLGTDRGLFQVPADFNAALPEDVLTDFER